MVTAPGKGPGSSGMVWEYVIYIPSDASEDPRDLLKDKEVKKMEAVQPWKPDLFEEEWGVWYRLNNMYPYRFPHC